MNRVGGLLAAGAVIAACSGEASPDNPQPATTTGTTSGMGGGAGDGGTVTAGGNGGSGGSGGATGDDVDQDGIADASEQAAASDYFPYYAIHSQDDCPRAGVLYRLSPHPADAALYMIWYVVLFENDCGTNGHVGDDEVFGAVIDPGQPPPAGILALRAISHQGTICQSVTTCGSLAGCNACTTADKGGQAFPVVYTSRDKHGSFISEATCDASVICDAGGCDLGTGSADLPFVNAGEPGHPLVNDLTAGGFITSANGWTESELMGFDPWGGADFGGAGNVTDDLQDTAFVVSPGGC